MDVHVAPYTIYVVIGYFAVCVMIGIAFTRAASKDFNSFFLANRELSYVILIGTIMSTQFSSVIFVGTPSLGWTWGIAGFVVYMGMQCILRIPLGWVGQKYRVDIPEEVSTLPDLMEHFYERGSRLLSTVIMFFYVLTRFTAQMVALGYLFQMVFGWTFSQGLVIGAAVVLAYTGLSGLWAVAITDWFQSILMAVAIGLALPFAFRLVGGWPGLSAKLPEKLFTLSGGRPWAQWLGLTIGMALPLYADPTIYQRFGAAKRPDIVRNGTLIAVLFWLFFGFFACVQGMVSRVLFPQAKSVETAVYATQLSALPSWLSVLWLIGFLAANMSTSDSYLLVAASLLSRDVIQRCFPKFVSERNTVTVTRLCMVIVLVMGIGTSLWLPSVWGIYQYGSLMYSSCMFTPLLLGLLWRGKGTLPYTAFSGLTAMVIGAVVYFGCYGGLKIPDTISFLWAAGISCAVFMLVNLMFGERKDVKKLRNARA